VPKLTPVVARTPAALAEALGLSAADAKEWQRQEALLKKLKHQGSSVPGRREAVDGEKFMADLLKDLDSRESQRKAAKRKPR
jgi:hypothetical protein